MSTFSIYSTQVKRISDEPFILASQALQMYYVPDPVHTEWAAVVQSKPREVYDFDNLESESVDNDYAVVEQLAALNENVALDIVNATIPSVRNDIDGIIVDPKKSRKGSRK